MRAGFSRAFAHVLTAAMASFQFIAPLEWQASDARGRRMHFLDLNFGELDFDVAKRRDGARLRGCRGAGPRAHVFVKGPRRRRRVPPGARVPPAVAPRRRFGCVGAVPGCRRSGAAGAGHSRRATLPQRGPDNKRGDGDEDAEILTSARRVRREVFCAEQRVPVEMERDAHDASPSTIHVVALHEDFSPWDVTFVPRPVGAARVVVSTRKAPRQDRARLRAAGPPPPGHRAPRRARVCGCAAAETPGLPRDAREPGPRRRLLLSRSVFVVSRARPFMDGPGCLHRTMVMET